MEADFENAIPVPSVRAEYVHIDADPCTCGTPRKRIRQSLIEHEGAHYDFIETECGSCAAPKGYTFDISSFFGRM